MLNQADLLQICAADPFEASQSKDGAWIKLLPAGTFSTRDGRGPFHAGGEAEMKAIVERTLDYLGDTEMMMDYDHQSFFGAVEGVGGTAKAAGWVKEFDVRSDGIYGRVEWTDAAKAAIEAVEYRYISPTFSSNKKTGRVGLLFNAALVNSPAMDLAAIAASANLTLTKGPDMDPEILEALGLAEGASEADVLSALQALQSGYAQVALAAGLAKDADFETVAAAVKKAVETNAPDPAKFVPVEQVTALQADLSALKSEVSGDKAETAVDEAIKAGKLAPALKDWGLQLAKSDLAKFEAFTASAPVLTGVQLGTSPKTESNPDLDDTDLQVMSQMGLSEEEMVAAKKDLGT
ncbi:phage protease [Roseibium porphyridii]|uniref:Phage protease n=1 Tax=Roseibium porphyridii TaxID=2866279 RepID=A0ABY8FDL7_9HYPH|nr:phage protease [Roseibium sp. KMA01]WFE92297.1 phage protease [Roseibium sp. KMA01]